MRQELIEYLTPMASAPSSAQQESGAPVTFTTEASVTANKIHIEIHEDIYNHIGQYLATGDYFHGVEESYKLVREKLREVTGKEKASDVFNNSAQSDAHYKALFGKAKPTTDAEADFFRGIGYLHLGVQHLRNEKAHTPATPMEPNLAIHYVSLASLAYDLITRYVSEDTINEIEAIVLA
ncbi:TIGR02391 family protein, partial [Bacillus pumilus]|uniref:TIGR02391 family protein n=1 Tax=Bacillus pumilus TaxID=1408 RepID=UPI001123C443